MTYDDSDARNILAHTASSSRRYQLTGHGRAVSMAVAVLFIKARGRVLAPD